MLRRMTPQYTVRPVRAHEWREARALRLAALTDEAAPIAFLETYDRALDHPDAFWQGRTADAAEEAGPDATARQFVAISDDGAWVGSAVALIERAGEPAVDGVTFPPPTGLLVAVYLAPGHRGRGVLDGVFAAALDWLRASGAGRVRLHVHERNARAQRFYDRQGFRPTGAGFTGPNGPEIELARAL